MDSPYQVDKNTYRQIQKLTRAKFDDWCVAFYKAAYQDGKESVKAINDTELLKVISGVKGIGPKRLKAISKAIDERFSEEN